MPVWDDLEKRRVGDVGRNPFSDEELGKREFSEDVNTAHLNAFGTHGQPGAVGGFSNAAFATNCMVLVL